MANALIAHVNHIDDAATKLAAGSQVSTLPVENVADVQRSKVWRTSGIATSYFTADFGVAKPVAVLWMAGTNLTSAATIRLRASDSDVIGGDLLDTGTISAGVDDNYRSVLYVPAAPVTARLWRIDIADPGLTGFFEIGRVFMGPAWVPSTNMAWGWSLGFLDDSVKRKSRGGQTFVDRGRQARRVSLTLDFLSESEMYSNAVELDRANGLNRDVLFCADPAGAFVSQQTVFGLVAESGNVINRSFAVYRKRYVIEERL